MEGVEGFEEDKLKPSFVKKQDNFVKHVLDMPFSILCRSYEDHLKSEAGITDWREDLQHLHNQLDREQPGTCIGYDAKQKKKDNRKLKELISSSKTSTTSTMDDIEEVEDDEEQEEDDVSEEYTVKERRSRPLPKLDVMGPESATADRLGLCVRARCMMTASVANALGVNISPTPTLAEVLPGRRQGKRGSTWQPSSRIISSVPS